MAGQVGQENRPMKRTQQFEIPRDYFPEVRVYRRSDTRVKWWLNYVLPDGKRMRVPAHNDEARARKLARAKKRELQSGFFDAYDQEYIRNLVLSREPSFEHAVEHFIMHTAENKSPDTIYSEKLLLGRVTEMFEKLGARGFVDIDPSLVQAFRDETASWLKDGKSVTTVNNYRRRAKRFTKFLAKEGLIRSDPLAALPLIRESASESARNVVIPDDHLQRILSVPRKALRSRYDLPSMIAFTLQTGLRAGEVLHLEWSDVDLNNAVIYIRVKPKCPTRYGFGWRPKWSKERVVPLTDEALRILRGIERREPVYGRVGPRGDLAPSQFVFPKSDRLKGKRIWTRVDRISAGWKGVLKAAGLSEQGYEFKDLRNTTSTWLTQRFGFTAKEESEILGHSERVAQKHYTALQMEQARARMSNLPTFRDTPALRLVKPDRAS